MKGGKKTPGCQSTEYKLTMTSLLQCTMFGKVMTYLCLQSEFYVIVNSGALMRFLSLPPCYLLFHLTFHQTLGKYNM